MNRVFSTLDRRLKIVMVAVLAAILGMTIVGCSGKSSEDVIREGVTQQLEEVKDFDDETIKSLSSATAVDLSEWGIDIEEFCRTWLSDYDYKVEDVVVDGDDATVKVSITNKSLGDALTTWFDDLTERSADEAIAAMSDEERYELVGSSLMEAIKAAPSKTNSVELPYKLENNVWTPGTGFETLLTDAFIGEIDF